MSKTSRRPVSMARRAISTGVWPAMMGRLVTSARSASCGELELGGRALGVERGEQDLLAVLVAQAQRELAGGGGLAGALQADHQDGDGGRRR